MVPADPEAPASVPPDPRAAGRDAARWAIFLDVDGTLVALQDHPDQVRVEPDLGSVLARLSQRLDRAVALVSGRPVAALDRLFAPLRLPAAGLHGLEHRGADGTVRQTGEAQALEHLRPALREFTAHNPGVWLEDKGRGLALHYRKAPDAAEAARALVRRLVDREDQDLSVLDGKMVIEIKPGHADKGSAIAAFLDEPPFRGRVPVFLGDDVTDEDGFEVVNARGGISVRVGGGASCARYALPDEQAVAGWLRELAEGLEDERAEPR